MHQTLDVDYYFDDLAKIYDLFELVHEQTIKAKKEAASVQKDYPEVELEISFGVDCRDKIENYLVDLYRKANKLEDLRKLIESKSEKTKLRI